MKFHSFLCVSCSETSSQWWCCLCFSHIKRQFGTHSSSSTENGSSEHRLLHQTLSEERLRWAWSLTWWKAALVLHTVQFTVIYLAADHTSCHLEVLCTVRWRERNVLQTRTCVQLTLPWWFKEPHVPDTTLLSNTGWRLRCLSCFPILTDHLLHLCCLHLSELLLLSLLCWVLWTLFSFEWANKQLAFIFTWAHFLYSTPTLTSCSGLVSETGSAYFACQDIRRPYMS